jgi:uncharacterized membrane protein
MSHETAAGAQSGFSLQRIEAFSDGVFAFALTLLVVSLDVPKSAHDLFATMRGFLAFGICFAFLGVLWVEHNRYFKRYAVADTATVALNMLLLFVVLLYVYPMKFLFTMLVDGWMWGVPIAGVKSDADVKQLMQIYGLGFLAINAVMLLLYRHSYVRRAQLALAAPELVTLRGAMRRNLYSGAIALLSILIARYTADAGLVSGLVYCLLGVFEPLNARATAVARRAAPG